MSLLNVINVSHGYGDRQILKNATFRLLKGEHIGLVGANGEGKSTFINILLKDIIPDEGRIEWAKYLNIGYLDQFSKLTSGKTVRMVLRDAFKSMYVMEKEIISLYEKMADATESEVEIMLEDIGEMQSILEHSGFYLIDVRIEEVGSGLGLMEVGLEKDVSELSGGQRAKVLLAKLLLQNPQVLILDEPTNFLDENHIEWLKQYLLSFENAFILVSHDMSFLNQVVNVIYHIDNGGLTRYTGNYEQFLQMYEVKRRQIDAAYNAQQKEIKNMEDFIARNKARVATRSMANSRQKKLDKMILIDKVHEKIKPIFKFKEGRTSGKVLFSTHDLVIGYETALSKPIEIEIIKGEKIAIRGVNGIGKSTLLKTLIGNLDPFSGEITISPTVQIGYFEQETLENRKTPMLEIADTFPTLNNGEVIASLASCGLTNDNIKSQIITLSGGEAAKVRLCKLTIQESNCLILDEPTNHLDILAKEALREAIINYKGTVIIVSHEPDFYQDFVTRTINVEEFSLKL